jgi:hypothetical protein
VGDATSVLLVDDGELDALRSALRDLQVQFSHLRPAVLPKRLAAPADLLVVTEACARAVQRALDGGGRPVRVAVVASDDPHTADRLRDLGFDYLVRAESHATSLRLLTLGLLYRGRERRQDRRVVVGREAWLRSGLRKRTVLLADLSLRGARVLADRELEPGTRVTLILPEDVTGGASLSLAGQVARASGEATGAGSRIALVIELDELAGQPLETLAAVLRRHPEVPCGEDDAPQAARPHVERRRNHRGIYDQETLAFVGSARRVLFGRDLSAAGMRVDPHEDLAPGLHLDLAICCAAGEPPLLVHAVVVRDDGPRGFALRFERLAAAEQGRLDRLVATLPSVEQLGAAEPAARGTFPSEIRAQR